MVRFHKAYWVRAASVCFWLWLGFVLCASAGRAMVAGQNVVGLLIAALSAVATWHAVFREGVAMRQVERSLIKEAVAKPLIHPQVQPVEPAKFEPLHYWKALWVASDLSAAAAHHAMEANAASLNRHPLIVLDDLGAGRVAILRNPNVPWVRDLDWKRFESELVVMEVLCRVESWIDSWDKDAPAAADQAMQQAMTVQNKAETLSALRAYIEGGGVNEPELSGVKERPIVYLTSTPQMRVLGNLLVARWLLRHLPGAMSRAQAQPALLLRWSEAEVVRHHLIQLPNPGWIAGQGGNLALLYFNEDAQSQGTALEKSVVVALIEAFVYEATHGNSSASIDQQRAAFDAAMASRTS